MRHRGLIDKKALDAAIFSSAFALEAEKKAKHIARLAIVSTMPSESLVTDAEVFELQKKDFEYVKKITSTTDFFARLESFIVYLINNPIIQNLKQLQLHVPWLFYIIFVFRTFIDIFYLIDSAFFSKDHQTIRTTNVIRSILNIAVATAFLAIISLGVLSAPALTIISATVGFLFTLSYAFAPFAKFLGFLWSDEDREKYEEDKKNGTHNLANYHLREVGDSIHYIVISSISLLGAALCFIAPMAGIGLMLGVSAYGFYDYIAATAVNKPALNPIRYVFGKWADWLYPRTEENKKEETLIDKIVPALQALSIQGNTTNIFAKLFDKTKLEQQQTLEARWETSIETEMNLQENKKIENDKPAVIESANMPMEDEAPPKHECRSNSPEL